MNTRLILVLVAGFLLMIFVPWSRFFIFLGFIYWLVTRGLKFFTNGFSMNAKVRPYTQVPSAKDIVYQVNENTSNPWLKKIASSPMYGKVPENIVELMKRVSADPKEKVISAIWTWHGVMEQGYLVITTEYLRWIRIFPSGNEDEFFNFGQSMDKYGDNALTDAPIVGTVLNVAGLQFQVKFNKNAAREFKQLYGVVQQTLMHHGSNQEHSPEHEKEKHIERKTSGGVADELEKLAALHKQKILTDEEFQSAKQKLIADS